MCHAESETTDLAKSAITPETLIAACAEFVDCLSITITETADHYRLVIRVKAGQAPLRESTELLLDEIICQQARVNAEARFAITRDELVRAAFRPIEPDD